MAASNDKTTQELWLDYAWKIVSAPTSGDAHIPECFRGKGAPPIPGLTPAEYTVRLPGYMGAAYEPGKGVLLVSAILTTEQVADPKLLPAVRGASAWVQSGRSARADALFFETTAAAYAEAMTSWLSWKHYGPILAALNLSPADVAFVATAKCWFSWGGYDTRNVAKNLASKCRSKFSNVADLVHIIQPKQTFYEGTSAVRAATSNPESGIFVFNALNGSVDGMAPWPSWLEIARANYYHEST